MRRACWAGTLMFVSLLALAGCGGPAPAGSGPSRGPGRSPAVATSTPAQAPTSTAVDRPGPSPVEVPAAARAHTRAGAEAFAQFYFRAVGSAFEKGDPGPLTGLSAVGCLACGAFVRQAETFAHNHYHSDGSALRVKLVHTFSYAPADAVVDVAGIEEPVRIMDAGGRVVRTTERDVVTFRTALRRTGGTWQVRDVHLI